MGVEERGKWLTSLIAELIAEVDRACLSIAEGIEKRRLCLAAPSPSVAVAGLSLLVMLHGPLLGLLALLTSEE